MLPQSSTNLRNRVNKLYLPKTKPLFPVFEAISNSIHAIQEKTEKTDFNQVGKISIKVIRNGREEVLKDIESIEEYPINSLQIKDNGIGLDEDNFISFMEFDSKKKVDIGGKGIGRLVCLKAFNKLIFNSVYFDKNEYKIRSFEYKKTKEGFDNYEDDIKTDKKETETTLTLYRYEDKYQKQVPLQITDIARQIITHFQLYFIQKIEPQIIIWNQNNTKIDLTTLFNKDFEKEILSEDFQIYENKFKIYISKSYRAKSHKIHYCGHERTVKDEYLSKYLEDFRYKMNGLNGGYFFQVFIVGEFLNKNVNEARTNFNFSLEEESDVLDMQEITLSKIRNSAIQCIEELLMRIKG